MIAQVLVTRHWSPLRRIAGIAGAALLSSGAAAGCVRAPLIPLTAATDDGVVTLHRGGVELTAEVKPGVQHLPSGFTPIRISVTNYSDNGIYVAPEDIELAAGSEVIALQTIPAEELPPPRPLGLGMDPASPYASAQGPSGAASGYFGQSPSNTYVSGGWRDPMAWSWITNTAFTGGFIDIGERRSGYVYFPTPPEALERLDLRVPVRSGSGSGPMELFEVPYGAPG